ncbi:hypothetical protein LTR17_000992 [Elasticomyces elasticus]|nr:hypothetical protein LTR17_000992 [Elasticomyces elasticus]
MASTLTLSRAENERLSKEIEVFQHEQLLLTDEIDRLRARQPALEGESQGLKTDNARLLGEVERLTATAETRQRENDELRAESEALQRDNEALETEMRAAGQDHRLLSTSFWALQVEKRTVEMQLRMLQDHPRLSNKETAAGGLDPPRTLKREVIEIDCEEDTTERAPKRQQSELATSMHEDKVTLPALVPVQGVDSPRLDTPNPSAITTNSTTNLDVEIADLPAEQAGRQPLAVKVLAFDQEGETYILGAARYPDGLPALIGDAEAVCEEAFEKHPHAKNRGYTSWREFAQSTQGCIRQFCRYGNTFNALQDPGRTACQRCFNARLPCLRYDADDPICGIYVVPLPVATRVGVEPERLEYYVYPEANAQRKLQKDEKIWGGRIR